MSGVVAKTTFVIFLFSVLLGASFVMFPIQEAEAAPVIIEGSIDPGARADTHFWEFTGTDGTSSLTVTLVCGNTGDTSKSLDPILQVRSPSISRGNDDGFTPCDSFSSSIVEYDPGEVEDGLWTTISRDFDDGTGPYTLTLTLTGPGEINQIADPPAEVVQNYDKK